MIDQIQIQDDLFGLLMSDSRLDKINIVNERKFRLVQGALYSTIWMTPRGGCSGQGILVEMPRLSVDDPNVSGPKFKPILTFVCIQVGDVAFAPATGAQLYAEWIAQIVTDILHLQSDDGFGVFMCSGPTIERATDPEFQGTNAMRVTMHATPTNNRQSTRVPPCAATVTSGSVTLSCPDTQATVYYTTDGTFPGKGGNPAAVRYAVPFAAVSGQALRFAAYRTGFINSPITKFKVP